MDLSKLPKLSQTPPPPSNDPLPVTPIESSPPVTQGIGPEIWFNTIMGIIAVVLGKAFAIYIFDRLTGRTFHTGINWTDGPLAGQEVSYPDLMGHVMLVDAGVFGFGVIILLEVLIRVIWIRGWRVPIWLATSVWMLAIISTAVNVYVCVRLFAEGIIPITSGLAAAFGGFIIADMRRAMLIAKRNS